MSNLRVLKSSGETCGGEVAASATAARPSQLDRPMRSVVTGHAASGRLREPLARCSDSAGSCRAVAVAEASQQERADTVERPAGPWSMWQQHATRTRPSIPHTCPNAAPAHVASWTNKTATAANPWSFMAERNRTNSQDNPETPAPPPPPGAPGFAGASENDALHVSVGPEPAGVPGRIIRSAAMSTSRSTNGRHGRTSSSRA